jgi:hypothetical protein
MDHNDYSGTFVDWGTNTIGSDAPGTWRTLTIDEWKYLLNYRHNASSLVGVAYISGKNNGLILLPDNWSCPEGITFKPGYHKDSGPSEYGLHQTFSVEEWEKLETSGAVFLTATGYREGVEDCSPQFTGWYWSATPSVSDACYISFGSWITHFQSGSRCTGYGVRLVKDL